MGTNEPGRSDRSAPAEYATVLRRYAGSILVLTLVALGSAFAITRAQVPVYTSAESVVVEPRVLPNGTASLPDMGTEREIATSGSVAALAAEALKAPLDGITDGLSVGVPADTHVLNFSYTSSSPPQAKRHASAFANAYIKYRVGLTKPDVGAPRPRVITAASLPASPSSPSYPLNLGVALLIGICLGIGTAVVRDRFDDRLRGARDLELRTGAPVLAAVRAAPRRLPAGPTAPLAILRAPESASAEAFRYLRTKILHAASTREAQTLVLTSAGEDSGRAVCGANLAAAIALSGRRVIVVCVDRIRTELAGLLCVDKSVVFMAAVRGHEPIAHVLHDTDIDTLRVLPLSLSPLHAGNQLADTMRATLPALCQAADLVLIDTAPILASADTVAIVGLADMTLLLADSRHSTRSAVRAASLEIEQAGGQLIGSVLVIGRRVARRPQLRVFGSTRPEAGPAQKERSGVLETQPNRSSPSPSQSVDGIAGAPDGRR
jgi:polysaccharide biosynthesis transport protein